MNHRRCTIITLTGYERYGFSRMFLDELVGYIKNHFTGWADIQQMLAYKDEI
ncbi:MULTISPECIES: hypothetical protein [Bacillaceae]|uniref:hypothetical protein n=1 Tax=Bacillaceae TaxID=186817 RepID=UPI00135C264A|nr:hypothetical protein [Salicibibacter kimchii]